MKAIDLQKQLTELVAEIYKAIHATCINLIEGGKGYKDHNDAFGNMDMLEFDEPNHIWLKRHKMIRGVAVQGSVLYLHIQDTSNKSIVGTDHLYPNNALCGADYLHPFDETTELTPHMLTKVLAALEKM